MQAQLGHKSEQSRHRLRAHGFSRAVAVDGRPEAGRAQHELAPHAPATSVKVTSADAARATPPKAHANRAFSIPRFSLCAGAQPHVDNWVYGAD